MADRAASNSQPPDETALESAPQPSRNARWDVGFGLVLVAFAVLALLVWFPNNIAGGFIVTSRAGKIGPGDAFFPVLLAGAILVLSLIDLAMSALRARRDNHAPGGIGKLTPGNLAFLGRFHVAVFLGLVIMFWLGPIVTALQNVLTDGALTYRQLADTVPYKYIGFIVGAAVVTLPTIAWAEGGWRARSVLCVLAVVAMIIVVFDVLLTNVQLPPNADY